VILTGCAHNGVLNMIAAAKTAFPDRPIQAVIGGFHLKRENSRAVRQIGEILLDMDIPMIYTGHCTGDESYGYSNQSWASACIICIPGWKWCFDLGVMIKLNEFHKISEAR
jgi:metal-dependent hydrolase (beta-lactamase superfamily II)